MKCPIDQTEMEKGFTDAASWIAGDIPFGSNFLKGRIKLSMWPFKREINYIIAYRCPKCGKVELTTEIDKKEE